jgi:signal transduction histidine kinase/CheY-like chemotaxis protein
MATPSGISALGELEPGSHIGQFYWDQHDLLETLVPYFATGLAQHERCIWACSEPLCAAHARGALAKLVPDLAERERVGQISIFDHDEWYTARGNLSPDQVIEAWLQAEQEALAAGYKALRISGNTFWLEPEQWHDFAEYEARVHTAFRDRKIVAVCSYPLGKCDSDHVVDVLHNHGASLVRTGSEWTVVHGATAALATVDTARRTHSSHSHSVDFYRQDFPADRVADRLRSALERGVGAAALVTREHGNALRAELLRQAVDVNGAIGRGQLAILDADAVFEAAWARPGLRTDVIAVGVRTPIGAIIERYGSCVAFGELVDLFARAGDHAAALELEAWWNQQLELYSIDLACGYSLASFAEASALQHFRNVCNEHRELGIDGAVTASDEDRLRVELAQITHALAKEMARRQVVDVAYAGAREAREHLVLLNRLTAALGEVTTRAQFVELVRDMVASALGAASIVIIEAEAREPLVADGIAITPLSHAAQAPTLRTRWSTSTTPLAAAPPELHAFAVVPLMVGTRVLARLALGFTQAHEFAASYRALVEDIARQLALALDRAVSYERLEHERQRAELASRAKDEFLAMLGHELRNPLSPILTATQLMRLRAEDVFEKERTVIERQVKHMIRLVDDLLDVSRITRGKVELRRRPVELSEVIAQAVELASPAIEERAHRLLVDVPNSGVVVHGDAARLAQVFGNLLNNAAKYTPHGGSIELLVRAKDAIVVASVRDTGIGIGPKLLGHVFELFVQARQGIDRAAGGLGLGLAIAKTLVELHGGTIEARSEGQGRGSEFIVTLPRHANTRPSRNNNSGTFALASLRPCRVLVVDDNEDAAFLFSEALRKLGHRVEVAHDGPSALALARQSPPEIAFLDIGLPVMDGYELGRRLKELGIEPPKLVAVTGYGHSSDRMRSRDAGFDLHLVKPIDLTAIQDALAKLQA